MLRARYLLKGAFPKTRAWILKILTEDNKSVGSDSIFKIDKSFIVISVFI